MTEIESAERFHISLAVRSGCLSVVVAYKHRLVEVFRSRRAHGQNLDNLVVSSLCQLARDYNVTRVVAEEDSPWLRGLADAGFRISTISLGQVKALLLPEMTSATLPQLFQFLLDHYPQLKRLVTVNARTGELSARNDKRRTVPLLAVALGLGFIYEKCLKEAQTKAPL